MYSPEDKILSKNIFLNKIFCVWNIEDILFKISSLGIWSTPRKLSACSITKKKCIQSINFYSHRKILFPSRGNPTSRVFHFSFLNRNQIVYIIFQLIWNQTERYISVKMYMYIKKYFKCISLYIHLNGNIFFRLVPNQSKNSKYNLISVWFNKNSERFLCVQSLPDSQNHQRVTCLHNQKKYIQSIHFFIFIEKYCSHRAEKLRLEGLIFLVWMLHTGK